MSFLAGIDIETTGLEIGDHRIVELYIGLWRPTGELVYEYEQRIDPQRAIAADAQRVHGISSHDLIGKPIWSTVAPIALKVIEKADGIVWHNGDEFDGKFLEYEFKRASLAMPARPAVDTMKNGVWATPDGKKPSLGELCFACGVDYDPAQAHAAAYDVTKMMDCYFKALDWGFFEPVIDRDLIAA